MAAFAFGSAIKPLPDWTTLQNEYWRECVNNEAHAVENWKKKYGHRLESYDAMYKHIPNMQRCIAGIDTQEGLRYIETGGYPTVPRPKSVGIQEMSKKSFVNRPKSGAQKVGYGGLGPMSDYIEPPRAADTIYERDYCVRLDEFKPHIRGINMTKKSVDGPWRRPGDGTMAVIPTKWQFPPGTKQPEGFLVRSELRKLRLEKEQQVKKSSLNAKQGDNISEQEPIHRNPLLDTCKSYADQAALSSQIKPPQAPPERPQTYKRTFSRERKPTQSRSWAPANDTAPKGWYKTEIGPGKIHIYPGRESILNTPQARLNVLKRRIDRRAQVLASM